jgi:hypothetical protein
MRQFLKAGGCPQVKAQLERERFLLQGSLQDLLDAQMNLRQETP